MKWTDGVAETREDESLFLQRLKWYLIDMPDRDEWGNWADGRAAAWTYGFARGLFFRYRERQLEDAVQRYEAIKAEYPELDEAIGKAVRIWMNEPTMARNILPPRPVVAYQESEGVLTREAYNNDVVLCWGCGSTQSRTEIIWEPHEARCPDCRTRLMRNDKGTWWLTRALKVRPA